MKRRDFFRIIGGGAIVAAFGTRSANAKVCERNVGTLRAIYPVGAIYISTSSTDPENLFGFGTWQRFGEGAVLAGVSKTDSDFDFRSNFQVRGAKTHTLTIAQMPSHSHGNVINISAGIATEVGPHGDYLRFPKQPAYTASAGSGSAHNNLQPYITVFMWRRSG